MTAYLLLTDVVPLKRGDWVIQNAANSPTGRAVTAIAKSLGIHTVNVVRSPSAAVEIESAGGDVALIDGPDLLQRVAETTGRPRSRWRSTRSATPPPST